MRDPKKRRSGNPNPQGNKGKGRKPGSPNKVTANAREAIAAFVDENAPRLQEWLDRIAEEQGPAVAFRCVQDLLEYHVPKLQRTEITGKDGTPFVVQISPEDNKL